MVRGIAILCILLSFTFKSEKEEYELKFGIATKLFHYIKWPENAMLNSDKFNIALYKENPFGEITDFYMKKMTIKGKKTNIYVIDSLSTLKGTHVLFVPKEYKSKLTSIALSVPSDVLIISECLQCGSKGGMINLSMENSIIKFQINKKQITNKGFKVNSKLYKLGKIVK